MPDAAEVERARELLQTVIRVQKNVYIKELMHEHEVKGGAKKEEFAQHLDEAIVSGQITLAHLTEWLEKTEGWGDEHVYLYRVPDKVCQDVKNQARRRVTRAGLSELWDAPASLEFPETRTLTGIYLTGDELRFVWHQGWTVKERVKAKDIPPREEEDGEVYSYEAYRHDRRRNVARVVIRPAARVCAIFLPGPTEPATHLDERQAMATDIARVFRLDDCALCPLEAAIPKIEKDVIKAKVPLQTRQTRLTDVDKIGYVEFGTTGKGSYIESKHLLDVRAVAYKGFTGATANFLFRFGTDEKPYTVRVNLYKEYDRIRLFVKLSRDEVWSILDLIGKYL